MTENWLARLGRLRIAPTHGLKYEKSEKIAENLGKLQEIQWTNKKSMCPTLWLEHDQLDSKFYKPKWLFANDSSKSSWLLISAKIL